MIFVALGSQKFQFNRLLKCVDEAIDRGVIKDEVIAQSGVSDYIPAYFKVKPFMDHQEFEHFIENSSFIISHGGVGVITKALRKGKKVLAMPRLAKYGEHVDDHQIQILKPFERSNYLCVCNESDDFEEKYEKTLNTNFAPFFSNNMRFVQDLEDYIETI